MGDLYSDNVDFWEAMGVLAQYDVRLLGQWLKMQREHPRSSSALIMAVFIPDDIVSNRTATSFAAAKEFVAKISMAYDEFLISCGETEPTQPRKVELALEVRKR